MTNRNEDNARSCQRARGRGREEVAEVAANPSYGSLIVYCWDFGFYSEKWKPPEGFEQRSGRI